MILSTNFRYFIKMDSTQLSSTECSPVFLLHILEAINSLNRQGNAKQIAEFIKRNYQYTDDIMLEVGTPYYNIISSVY